MVLNNGLIIQWGRASRSEGTITDIVTYTQNFPISFSQQAYSGCGITGTANGVVGIVVASSTMTSFQWSIKPNTNNTDNRMLYFAFIGI